MYCTIQDIIDDISQRVLEQLSNDNQLQNDLQETLILTKIEDMSSYIDSYLKGVYDIPITNSSDLRIIKPICVTLVVFEFYQRRLGLEFPQSLIDRRNLAIKDLVNIQNGVIRLQGNTLNRTNSQGYLVSTVTKNFTDELLSDF